MLLGVLLICHSLQELGSVSRFKIQRRRTGSLLKLGVGTHWVGTSALLCVHYDFHLRGSRWRSHITESL